MDEPIPPTRNIHAYISTDQGCIDIGVLKLDGFTIVRDEELQVMRSAGPNAQVIETLRMAQKALVTPQGQFKTKKAELAFYEIARVLGDKDPWSKI